MIIDDERRMLAALVAQNREQKPAGVVKFDTVENYHARLAPYKDALRMQSDTEFNSLLVHDAHNLGLWLTPLMNKETFDLFGSKDPSVVQDAIDHLQPVSPDDVEKARDGELGMYLFDPEIRKIVPALPNILKAISASFDFLQSLKKGTVAKQLDCIKSLQQLRVPLRPLVESQAGELVLLNAGNSRDFSINGLQFGVFYNLLHNAGKYGMTLNDKTGSKSVVQFDARSGNGYVVNYSAKPFPLNPESFSGERHFGIFIASLYTSVLDRKIDFESFKLNSGNPQSPEYLAVANVRHRT